VITEGDADERMQGADPTIGEPSALDATKVFRQERFEGMFREQVEKLRGRGGMVENGH